MADPTISEQPQPLQTIDPSTGFQPQQLQAPQPDAGAPQTGNVNPDAFQSNPTQVGGPAPQVQQAQEPPMPFWKRILMGAFAGMANSAGAHNWGQALGQGAGGALKQEQQVFENQQQQANTQSQIRFRDAQDAYNAAMLHVQQGHFDLLKGKDRRDAQDDTDKRAAFLQSMGANVQPIPVGSAGSGPATAFLNQASTQPGGAEVNPWTLSGPDQMYAVSFDGEQGPVKRYQVYADTAKGFNLPVADRQLVMGLNRQQQMQLEQLPSRYLNGSDENGKLYSKANEGQLRSAIETAQANIKQLSTDPEGNAQALANWQTRLVHLNSQMAGMNQANDAATQRQMQVAQARGQANNDSRMYQVDDPNGGKQYVPGSQLRQQAGAGTPMHASMNGAMLMGTLPDGRQVAGTQEELAQSGAANITKMSPDEAGKVHIARQLVAPNGLFHNVAQDIAAIGDQNLGPIASRWGDFVSGKVGDGPQFAKLRADMGLLSTALMQAHVGARGSEGMMEHFKHLADYRISDANTLRAALASEFNYVKEKAAFAPPRGK